MAVDSITLARPYAEAAFRRARETDQIERWSEMIDLLAGIINEGPVQDVLFNPLVSGDLLAGVIREAVGGRLTQEGSNFLGVLVENKRLALLPDISRLFDELKKESEGRLQVSVRSAFPLTASEEVSLIQALGVRLGKRVELIVVEDPALIGGVEVRAGDLVIDGSVRGRLDRLTSELQF